MVLVWWDFENCNLPAGSNVFKLSQSITATIRSRGIRGPITITAFGDLSKLSRFNQNALSSTGIVLKDVPKGGKTSAGLIRWHSHIPPPAHILLISSDHIFMDALDKLAMDKYNVLLASKTYAPDDLSVPVTMMWDWYSVAMGKIVPGIIFNRLPLGPYEFLKRIPLPDSFAAVEQSNSVKTKAPALNSNSKTEESTALSETSLQLDPGHDASALSEESSSSNCACWISSADCFSLRCFQQGEESRNVGVFVWWDFDDCEFPAGTNGLKVVQAITTTVRKGGIQGPITITAVGDFSQLSMTNWEALSSSRINLKQVPQGGEPSVYKALLTNIMSWVITNRPPAHIFVISSRRGLASTLHRLRMKNYNMLLASKANAAGVLCSASTIMWDWCSLVKGENVMGRHFNQPPDGPWYGHYRIPLEDPFAGVSNHEDPFAGVSKSKLSERSRNKMKKKASAATCAL